jgi:integration host factor subunit alpha
VLAELINHRTGLAKKDAQDLVDTVFSIIKEGLSEGERVKISGFGAFVVCQKRARRGRNPHTGAPMQIGPHRVLSFRPSQALKELVNSGHH